MTNQALSIAMMAAAVGCGGADHGQPSDGTGGGVGAGGTIGSGGVVSTGGTISTGGVVGTGASVGVGGIGSGGVVGTGGVSTPEGTLYTFDLTGFGTTEPSGLQIANETLAFPLLLGQTQQSLSLTNPGDLVVAYTRVGCWIDPEAWIGTAGTVPIELPQTEPVALTQVTIDQFVGAGVTATPKGLAEGTCLTLKSEGGTWTPFLQPHSISLLSGDSVRVEFVIEGMTAASVAIFLPTYTGVSQVSYRVASP